MVVFTNDLFFLFDLMYLVTLLIFALLFGLMLSNGFSLNTAIYLRSYFYFFVLQFGMFELLFLSDMLLLELDIILFNMSICINNLILFVSLLVLIFILFYLLISVDSIKYITYFVYEYKPILTIMFLGLCIFLYANDFFLVYLALEMQNLCFYILSSLRRYSMASVEAGLKYFMFGMFSSGLMIFGISLLYGLFGTLNFFDIELLLYFMDYNISIMFVFGFMMIGILLKLGAAPFHWWLPDVYEGSPFLITFFYMVVPKLLLFFFLFKLYVGLLYIYSDIFYYLFIMVAFCSMGIGLFLALYQFKLKSFLAVSSVMHTGFLLVAISLGTIESFMSLFIYYFIYIFVLFGIFIMVLNFSYNVTYKGVIDITEFFLLSKNSVILGLSLTALLFSLAGIPPFGGFFGKFYMFLACLSSYKYITMFMLFMFSILACLYYLRIVHIMYFRVHPGVVFMENYGFLSSYLLVLMVIFNMIMLGFLNTGLFTMLFEGVVENFIYEKV